MELKNRRTGEATLVPLKDVEDVLAPKRFMQRWRQKLFRFPDRINGSLSYFIFSHRMLFEPSQLGPKMTVLPVRN